MPKAFSEDEKQWIRQQLLEQGGKQFSLYGLKKTSVEELARACGISKAAFYLFYPSKEALFMDVVEEAERLFRREILAELELPGPTPRARLTAALQRAFTLWKTIPVLRFFTSSNYEQLARRIPPEQIQEHMQSDLSFIDLLIERCQAAGILVRLNAQQMSGLMYTLFFTALHEDDFGPGMLRGPVEVLLELTAAYCLGEIETRANLDTPS